MPKDLNVSTLLDFYGPVLTGKQRSFLEYYYNDDLSLSEIAENEGITRQGVRDAIKRAESLLAELEDNLHFAERYKAVHDGLTEISSHADAIIEKNMHSGLIREINDSAARIKALVHTLNDF